MHTLDLVEKACKDAGFQTGWRNVRVQADGYNRSIVTLRPVSASSSDDQVIILATSINEKDGTGTLQLVIALGDPRATRKAEQVMSKYLRFKGSWDVMEDLLHDLPDNLYKALQAAEKASEDGTRYLYNSR